MIANRTEIKTKLLIPAATTTYDNLIDSYIPIVTSDIVAFCNNTFVTKDKSTYLAKVTYSKNNTIAFVDSDPDTITDSASGFVTAGFISGDSAYVEDTVRNNQHVTIDTVAAGTLTLNTLDSVTTEAASTSTTPVISMVLWPNTLIPVFCNMIGWLLFQMNASRAIESKSLGPLSLKYDKLAADKPAGANMYPVSIVSGLTQHRYLRTA